MPKISFISMPFASGILHRLSCTCEGSEGWLVVYRPEVINQSFVSWPSIPPEAENDPFAIRDRELLESVLPDSESGCSKFMNGCAFISRSI
jgi:hypothetical protein